MLYLFIFLISNIVWADSPNCQAVDKNAPFNAYLITSGPGQSMYSRTGHSALWVSGGDRDDVFFNWGAYDSRQENFIWHFFMGTANYKLSLMSEERNTRIATAENRIVKAQHLNLSPEMRKRLQRKLQIQAKPENRSYLYHWETQNCATLIRDIVNMSTGFPWEELKEEQTEISRRDEVLRHLGSLKWAWFGWHFMGSSYAERPYTKWELMHIPQNLMTQASAAQILWEDGSTRPLVDYECILHDSETGWAPAKPPIRWPWLWGWGFILSGLIIKGFQSPRRWISLSSKLVLSTHFLFSGLLGTFFAYLWLNSSLEGYGPNENWFYANPFSVGLLFVIWKQNKFATLILWISSLIVAIGIISNLFTTQINIDFIGLFAVPCLTMFYISISHRK